MEKIKEFFTSRRLWCIVAAIALMAAIAFIYFYPDDAQGNVLVQHDVRQGIAIGQEAKAYAEATGIQSRWTGSLFSGMPTFQISPSYPSNSMFSWLSSVYGLGLPAPANYLFMMMFGFFILLLAMRMRWYVALIGAIAYGFSSYFIIIIGAGHIWKFTTLSYIPPTIAGIVLAYRGRYIAGAALAALFAMLQIAANHVQMTYYFLFVIIGFVIAALIHAIRNHRMRQWWIATAALAAAAILAVAANLPSLYNTYEYSKLTMRGGHSELSRPDDTAENASSGLDRDYITQYSYAPSETFSLFIPNIKGGASNKPAKGENNPVSLAQMPEAQSLVDSGQISPQEAQYLDYMSQYFGDPEGTNGPVYVGALIFALFLVGCIIVRGPLKWVLLVLTILSILLAFGRHFMFLTDLMIDHMPMYSKFRAVESILVIAEFTIPLLAAMALQKILSQESPAISARLYAKPVAWCFGIVLFLCIIGLIMPGFYGDAIVERDRELAAYIAQNLSASGADAQTVQFFSLDNPRIYAAAESLRHSLVESDSLRSLIIVAAGLILFLLYFRSKLSATVVLLGCGIIICGDLFLVNKRYISSDSFIPRRLVQADPFPLSPAEQAIVADTTSNFRVMNIPKFWIADPSYHYKTIGGYHAAKLTRYQDIIDVHLSHFLNNTPDDADWNVLNMLNARYVIDLTGQVMKNPEAMGNAWFVDHVYYTKSPDEEMNALSSIDPATTAVADKQFAAILGNSALRTPGDTIFLTSYAPNRLTYHASSAKGGVAVLSEVYFPWGWKAEIDGKSARIGRVNYILRAIDIPAGTHSVSLTFDPESIHTTTIAARIAIIIIYLLCIAAIIIPFIYRKPTTAASES